MGHWRLQLSVSTGRLLAKTYGTVGKLRICFRYTSLNLLNTNPSKLLSCLFSDVTCLPYVLPQQVLRVYRHGEIKQFWSYLWSRNVNDYFFLVFISVLLRCSKKVQSSDTASCRSPWSHADVGVAWSQVSRQWPFLILWPSQHVRSHSHVLLLHDVCHGTSISKVCTSLSYYVNTFATNLWRVYWPPKEMLLLKSKLNSFCKSLICGKNINYSKLKFDVFAKTSGVRSLFTKIC